MKIKMKTISAGPDPKFNWHEGEVREVCKEEGEYWIAKGVAVSLEQEVVKPAEKAVQKPQEKAVVTPSETSANGNASTVDQKPPVAPPAAAAAAAAAPAWGATAAPVQKTPEV